MTAIAPVRRPEEEYLAALRQGRFMIQRCRETGRAVFFPRSVSPHSGRPTLDWVAASGRGTVYSSTTVATRDGGYNVALIALEEGPRLMSSVIGVPPEAVRIGLAVVAEVDAAAEPPRVLFRPAAEAAR